MIRVDTEGSAEEALGNLKQIAGRTEANSKRMLPSLIAISQNVRYVRGTDNELLLVFGAYRTMVFATKLEIWIYATNNLRPIHFRSFKLLWDIWLLGQDKKILARADCDESARMLEFLDFKLVMIMDDIKLYEAR